MNAKDYIGMLILGLVAVVGIGVMAYIAGSNTGPSRIDENDQVVEQTLNESRGATLVNGLSEVHAELDRLKVNPGSNQAIKESCTDVSIAAHFALRDLERIDFSPESYLAPARSGLSHVVSGSEICINAATYGNQAQYDEALAILEDGYANLDEAIDIIEADMSVAP